jgi:hypothetical protein
MMVGYNQDGTIDLGFGGMVLNPANGKVSFNVGGTSTPVGGKRRTAGSMFQGTGVYAPRRRGGTADTMGRGVSTETNARGGMPSGARSAWDWRSGAGDITLPSTRLPSEEDRANEIVAGLTRLGDPSGQGGDGGGGGRASNPYSNAIRILQQQLDGGQYGTMYDTLSSQLGTTSGAARGQIDQATANAIAQINRQDPLATPINYSAGTTEIPQTALNNYLNAIGASTSSVDAGRNFLQGLIDTGASSAAQSQASQQQAYAAQRQAAIDALTGNQQLQQGNLASATQAQQMAIATAKERERKALMDQILQYVLQGGVA